ncbi:MAG TPA: hypothetical protein VNY24_11135 [Candidatus Acidoferrales bacterium]|jgi:hypothetical protein|nr:hypothetical protein [Candidatus Acidoferrales bacterium]
MTRPTVVISLDLELSWGSFDLSYDDKLLKMGRWTHDVGAPNLLNHLTRNGLSATWAIVGAMMRRTLPDVSGLPEVRYPHFSKPWFSHIPKDGDEQTHPEWFGASLVEMIRNAAPEQEIGFHSFSHVPFGERGMTRERAIAEYRYCAQIAQELGIKKSSFVFPRNSVAYLAELRDAGFTCFRDVDRLPMRFANGALNSLAMILADFAGSSPCMTEPSLKEGVVSIPGSLLIRYAAGWRKHIPDSSRLRRLRKGLERVRRERGVFHVWFHPENLYAGWPRVENVVARFLEELGALVRNGDVRCLTMGQLAAEFRNNSAVKQNSHRPAVYTAAGQMNSSTSSIRHGAGSTISI